MAAFNTFDENGDGSIDSEELKKILDAVSESDSEYTLEEVEKIIAEADSGGDGKISKDEFLELIWNVLEQNKPDEAFVELFKSFGAKEANDMVTIGDF